MSKKVKIKNYKEFKNFNIANDVKVELTTKKAAAEPFNVDEIENITFVGDEVEIPYKEESK